LKNSQLTYGDVTIICETVHKIALKRPLRDPFKSLFLKSGIHAHCPRFFCSKKLQWNPARKWSGHGRAGDGIDQLHSPKQICSKFVIDAG
jgi:hypothetical protein